MTPKSQAKAFEAAPENLKEILKGKETVKNMTLQNLDRAKNAIPLPAREAANTVAGVAPGIGTIATIGGVIGLTYLGINTMLGREDRNPIVGGLKSMIS